MARTTTHKHRGTEKRNRGPYGFTACVAPRDCNPMAHGGVVWVEVCSCGAERRRASTGDGRDEVGPWTRA